MNRALFVATIRQLFSQPVRVGALIGCTILPLLQLAVDPDPRLGSQIWAVFIAVIAGAGVIGLEVSTGSLALFFTRPITRATYVISRWAGAAAVGVTLVVLSLAGEAAVIVSRGGDLPPATLLLALADRLSVVFGVVSVMTCLSAIVSSLGDLVIWLSIQIVAMSLGASGEAAAIPLLTDMSSVLRRIASPEIDSFRILSSMRVPWSHLAFISRPCSSLSVWPLSFSIAGNCRMRASDSTRRDPVVLLALGAAFPAVGVAAAVLERLNPIILRHYVVWRDASDARNLAIAQQRPILYAFLEPRDATSMQLERQLFGDPKAGAELNRGSCSSAATRCSPRSSA